MGISLRLTVLRYLREVVTPERRRPTWFDLPELGVMVLAFLCYFLVRGGVVDRPGEALQNARWIIDLQRSLGLFVEPAVNAWTLRAPWRVDLFNFVYFWLDFPLIVAVGGLLFWRSRYHYTVLRDSMLLSGALALVFYWTFPVAPPRFLPEWGFVDTMREFSQLSYQAQSLQPFVNPFASVPSLHVGWSLLLTIVLFRVATRRAVRVAGVVVLGLQSVAVIATANHYLFDAAVGVAVSLLALVIAVWLERNGYPRLRLWLRTQVRRGERARPAQA